MFTLKEDEIIFDVFFNEPLSEKIMNELTKVKKITFGSSFNQPFHCLPDNITHITFGTLFNQSIDDSNLPKNLTHLTFFGLFNNFNQSVNNLPKSITHLTFGWHFNQKVDNLPINITHLEFDNDFNQPVDNLPNSIAYLKFGSAFNQPVDFLPSSLKELIFSRDFNQPVNNLPNNITHLTFGMYFNQPIKNLPISLTHLTIGEPYTENRTISIFNQSIECLSRLTNLKYLKFGNHFSQNICCPIDGHCYLPDSIEELYFATGTCGENENKNKITSFPKSLRKLYFKNKRRSIRIFRMKK